MTESTALRLADALDDEFVQGRISNHTGRKAAAELRRLHAENERLHQINQSHEMKLSVRGYEIQIEDLRLAHAELRERNAELLEALVSFTKSGYIKKQHPKRYAAAVAAIAKAEAQK
jgi:hypothetical protein